MEKIYQIGEFNFHIVLKIYDYGEIEYLPKNIFNIIPS